MDLWPTIVSWGTSWELQLCTIFVKQYDECTLIQNYTMKDVSWQIQSLSQDSGLMRVVSHQTGIMKKQLCSSDVKSATV